MRVRIIETMEQWGIFKDALVEKGYKLWQTQYGYDSPEGFHARFSKDDKQVEVATHNTDVQRAIESSRLI